jgi:CRP-like cAMP-binding protein
MAWLRVLIVDSGRVALLGDREGMSVPAREPRHMTPSSPSFLERLSDPERTALLSAGRVHHWSAQEVLFREGDPVTGALLITTGVLKIHKHSPSGDELILALSGAGDLLGEFAALDGATREHGLVRHRG